MCAMQDGPPLDAQLLKLVLPAAPGLSHMRGDQLTADLQQAGLSSIAAARLMLEIETVYNVSIPDAELTPDNFANVRAIERLIGRLR